MESSGRVWKSSTSTFDIRQKKCGGGVSGSVGTTFNIPKNIYDFVSRALKNKCPGPIIYDSSVAVVAEFRFCSACHNLLEKFVDVVGSLISSSYIRDTPGTVE